MSNIFLKVSCVSGDSKNNKVRQSKWEMIEKAVDTIIEKANKDPKFTMVSYRKDGNSIIVSFEFPSGEWNECRYGLGMSEYIAMGNGNYGYGELGYIDSESSDNLSEEELAQCSPYLHELDTLVTKEV
ncbi:hypothetical protein [Veillonella magna]|uniref:Uncharacterized protein n=1 Tax=Veillonella magna TaxID=464322 RepID=A0ABS2GCS0_9FIRM|nr:hypothetical protein [Veillonella magna]MBM6823580.1 hypothetical protein [Veillonella magna]MBM6911924.1 hypothetical protein [Veillonella magna]